MPQKYMLTSVLYKKRHCEVFSDRKGANTVAISRIKPLSFVREIASSEEKTDSPQKGAPRDDQPVFVSFLSRTQVKLSTLLCLLFLWAVPVSAQQKTDKVVIPVEQDVAWWIGVVNHGENLPIENGYHANLESNYGNQVQPLLLSSEGEVIWSEQPFEVTMVNDTLKVISTEPSLIYTDAGKNLKEGYLFASENYFPPAGELPDELLFSAPQYNTWIELMYDQNQEDILEYARKIVDNGFPPGVLMIDDNWQEDYGKWDFHPGRFSNPKAMVDSLHAMGFKVMLWMAPMISPDSDVYRLLRDEKMLLQNESGDAAVIRWWNGASGLLDLANPETQGWFKEQLDYLQETYHVDGFKFDAGDYHHYENTYSVTGEVSRQEHSKLYGKVGLDYPLNEYRAMWKMGGQPLVNRLRDKAHSWEDLRKLVPDILLQGIIGYNFTCPDMIGGGEFTSFLPGRDIDQELIVRSAQSHALMPMMQFSVAPWRILDETHLEAVKEAVALRNKYTPLIMTLARESAHSGEPIVRPMEYVFPHQGFKEIKDQFFLGDDLLVAPVLEKGVDTRRVVLPEGRWEDSNGKVYEGDQVVEVSVGLESLPHFVRK
ncbi:glycoside hydrolase family 31 protein [Gracilimonas mengyeensis]|uniref:Alpha-glucosidase n=1 Tax=Gracilimonas mengyeensis TaxID=1302730 RepID=A0A521BT90_9BACT|nr:glycoside hydrolase family 31 protein [Gracilimonas mengyeensis]SMO50349.1 alpha-glucosidase [Gracilimonas mengyeensis]